MQLQSFQTFDGLHAEVILPRYANCAQNYNKRTSLGLPGSEKRDNTIILMQFARQ